MVNVTGWNELINEQKIISANYQLFNTSLGGNLFLLLWCVLSGVLYIKTKSIELVFFLGLLSFSLFYEMLGTMGITLISTILIFELGVALYKVFWK